MSLFDIRGDGEIYYQGNRVGTLDIDILPSVEQDIFEYFKHDPSTFDKGYEAGVKDYHEHAIDQLSDLKNELI